LVDDEMRQAFHTVIDEPIIHLRRMASIFQDVVDGRMDRVKRGKRVITLRIGVVVFFLQTLIIAAQLHDAPFSQINALLKKDGVREPLQQPPRGHLEARELGGWKQD
jgi:hypothetical protein